MSAFHDRVLTRAWITCAVIALGGSVILWWRGDLYRALSFLLGAAVAIVNLRWLEYSVAQIMNVFEITGAQARETAQTAALDSPDTVIATQPSEDPQPEPRLVKNRPRIWPKMVLRYLFLGAVAYVILKGWFVSIGAFLTGLFLPIAALMLEAVYELIASFKS